MFNRNRENQDIISEIKLLDISEIVVSETAAHRIPSLETFMMHNENEALISQCKPGQFFKMLRTNC